MTLVKGVQENNINQYQILILHKNEVEVAQMIQKDKTVNKIKVKALHVIIKVKTKALRHLKKEVLENKVNVQILKVIFTYYLQY